MQKKKAAKLGGFIGALCASGALVGMAVSGTGAYFTDSHDGSVNASTGDVKVNTSSTTLSFDNLLPGQYKDQPINYQAVGTGPEDIWLVFPTSDGQGGNPSEAFTGNPDDAAHGGLGRYGHFAVSSTNGASFTSYNLSNPGTTPSHTGPSCSTDANGEGGSDQQAATKADIVPFCAPPNAILLASNLSYGDSGQAKLTFGYTPLLTNGKNSVGNVDNHNEDVASAPVVKFQIVATQHGVRPDDANN